MYNFTFIKLPAITLLVMVILGSHFHSSSSIVSAHAETESVFVMGSLGGVQLNPMIGFTYGLYRSVLYTTLFRFDENLEPQPWLATSYERTEPTVWTVTIREDAKWHDGEPITSSDVKFTLELVGEVGGVMSRFVKGIVEVETPNKNTVLVKTDQPTLLAPWLTSIYILPKHYWEANEAVGGKALEFSNVPPVGSGPFKFVDWKPGELLEFEAFTDFFLDTPKIDRLIWKLFSSPEPMIAALKTGEIDAADQIPIKFLRELEKLEGIQTEVIPNSALYDVYINQAPSIERKGHPALLDVNVRKAIFSAVDREYINEQVYDGRFFPALSIIPEIRSKYYCQECEAIHPSFDLEKAAQILDNAGYMDTDGDGIREDPISGLPLSFRWWTAGDQPEGIRIGEILDETFQKIGMELSEIKVVEGGSLWDAITVQFDYDLVYWSWSVQDESSIIYIFTSAASGEPVYFSSSQYRNHEFDKLYEQQLTAQTEDERVEAIKSAQTHIIENAVELVVVYPGVVSAWWSSKWTGNISEPTGSFHYGNLNSQMFLYLTPAGEEVSPLATSPVLSIALPVIIILVAVVLAYLFLRRRKQ
jgi:peptide/nickel transport system substrate-binding protein